MQLSNLFLLSTALAGAASAATLQNRSGGGSFFKAVKSATTAAPAPTATSTTKDVKTESIVSDLVDGVTDTLKNGLSAVVQEFCAGAKSRRATKDEIAYKGNTGAEGNYGCNMMEVAASLLDEYKYTMEIKNVADDDYEVVCWNKIGRDNGINGFFRGMGESVVLHLGPGESAVVAFDANTQGACGFGQGSLPTSAEGCYQGTWAEFDFENTSNDGWSGADCSALTSEDTGGKVEGCKLCDAGDKTCSIIYPDGTGDNAYTKGTNDLDGVGLNTAPGSVTYYLEVGYSK
jgi:hypothetical protein